MITAEKKLKDLCPADDITIVWLSNWNWTQKTIANINWKFTKKLLNSTSGITHVNRFVTNAAALTYMSNRNKAFMKGKS